MEMSSTTTNFTPATSNGGLTLGQALMRELRETRENLSKSSSLPHVVPERALPSKGLGVKRRGVRARRNPVWGHFLTTDDGWAMCRQCEYKTKSVYSTNLKLHLKSHHRPSYDEVLRAEQFAPLDGVVRNRLLVPENSSALVDALISKSASRCTTQKTVGNTRAAPLLVSILNDEKGSLMTPPLPLTAATPASMAYNLTRGGENKTLTDHLFERLSHRAETMDAPSLLASSEFELFVYSLAPDYRLPSSAS